MMNKLVLLFLVLLPVLALGKSMVVSEPIFIYGSPNFVAHNKDVVFSFESSEETKCKASFDEDIGFKEMPFVFDGRSFGHKVLFTAKDLDLKLFNMHYIFVRCKNINMSLDDPAFYWSFIILPEEDLPENNVPIAMQDKTGDSSKTGSQTESSSDSESGTIKLDNETENNVTETVYLNASDTFEQDSKLSASNTSSNVIEVEENQETSPTAFSVGAETQASQAVMPIILLIVLVCGYFLIKRRK